MNMFKSVAELSYGADTAKGLYAELNRSLVDLQFQKQCHKGMYYLSTVDMRRTTHAQTETSETLEDVTLQEQSLLLTNM